jgi:hypothetical protein
VVVFILLIFCYCNFKKQTNQKYHVQVVVSPRGLDVGCILIVPSERSPKTIVVLPGNMDRPNHVDNPKRMAMALLIRHRHRHGGHPSYPRRKEDDGLIHHPIHPS